MEEHHFTVLKTARYHTLGSFDDELRNLVFVLHGYRQLAGRFLSQFESLAEDGWAFVAPEGLSRFYLESDSTQGRDAVVGATWMTREDREHEIHDYVMYLDALYSKIFESHDRGAVKVVALGFSQGAAAVARWLAHGFATVEHAVLWGETLPADLNMKAFAARMSHRRLTIVVGSEDEFITDERIDQAVALIRRHDLDPETVRFDGGHHLDLAVLKEVLGA